MIKWKLKRDVLIKKIDKNLKDYPSEDDTYAEKYIEIIEKEFRKAKFKSDHDFSIKGRRKFLVNEFYNVLRNNDAYHALQKCDGLIITGPTGTNVNDVAVCLYRTK